MSDYKFTLEPHFRVYNDGTGDYVEIRPDADGLNLIEVNSFEDAGEKVAGMTIYPAAALLLAEALIALANKLARQQGTTPKES